MNVSRAKGFTALIALVLPLTGVVAAAADEVQEPEAGQVLDRALTDPEIVEASGMAMSTLQPGLLFTHNDSGDHPRVFAVGKDGETEAELWLRGAAHHDWEDISTGPDHTLWVGDIGDDKWDRDHVTVYSFKEPNVALGDTWVDPTAYTFSYPDGSVDAEALLVHPTTGELFIVSSARKRAAIYQAPAVLSTTRPNLLTEVAAAPTGVTGGAFAPDGTSFVLTTGTSTFLYTSIDAEPVELEVPFLERGQSVVFDCPWLPATDPSTDEPTTASDCTSAVLLSGTEGASSPVYRTPLAAHLGGSDPGRPWIPDWPDYYPYPEPPRDPEGGDGDEEDGPPLLGVYNGNAGERPDETTLSDFGCYPDVANSYYQPGQNINLDYEAARIRRGTSPNLTITTKGTQLLAGIARGEPAAIAWLDTYIAALAKLAAIDPATPVYATLEHEYRAKTKQGLVTGESADPYVYGKALSVFYARANAAAPAIRTTYWIVGYDREFEGAVGDAFTVRPEVVVFDPYANTGTDTIATITEGDLEWINGQDWYDGQEIGLGEFGMPVRLGDAALQRFFTDVRGQLEAQDIDWAVFFNRTRDNNHKITTGAYPGAVAAFSASARYW